MISQAGFFLIQYAHLWKDHLEKLFNLYASGKLKNKCRGGKPWPSEFREFSTETGADAELQKGYAEATA
ncbi:hypothetical protein SORBI_3002G234900 [Sorghum bicolor]|uniref:Uncharacterized protein n=1 Tax=Sorghum bicolor TaxID=4558 RepID=A0A1B6QD29_SORBI|nr:hypothetical protein SORBI_3002G234900 [Sorghum bicolor]